jgi:O-methyltransferase
MSIRGKIQSLLFRVLPGARPVPRAESNTLFCKAAWFMVGNRTQGDFIEFGVFRGASIVDAYFTFEDVFRVSLEGALVELGHHTADDVAALRETWRGMRFFAFDSFQGLPKPEGVDEGAPLFQEGKYATSQAAFRAGVRQAGVPDERVVEVPGWFEDSCTPATRERLGLQKAAVVHVDCDLYSSALTALHFVTPLLQEGTLLVFDDWYFFSADPHKGEQRAFREWAETLPQWGFVEYHKEGPFRMSFIVTRR